MLLFCSFIIIIIYLFKKKKKIFLGGCIGYFNLQTSIIKVLVSSSSVATADTSEFGLCAPPHPLHRSNRRGPKVRLMGFFIIIFLISFLFLGFGGER